MPRRFHCKRDWEAELAESDHSDLHQPRFFQ